MLADIFLPAVVFTEYWHSIVMSLKIMTLQCILSH